MVKHYKMSIILPPRNHLIIVKKNNNILCIIYNEFFYYKLGIDSFLYSMYYNKFINSLTFFSKENAQFNDIFKKNLETLLFSLNFYFIAKFKFKGKGYRIFRRKDNKFIKFFFGHSHMRFIKFRFAHLLKPHKYKFLIFSNSISKIKKTIILVNSVKPLNLYTKRGIGFTRQIIYKRKGKGALI